MVVKVESKDCQVPSMSSLARDRPVIDIKTDKCCIGAIWGYVIDLQERYKAETYGEQDEAQQT